MFHRPLIVARIPSDIATADHAGILARIAEVNAKLDAQRFATDRGQAQLIAATALSNSGVGACGIPTTQRVSK